MCAYTVAFFRRVLLEIWLLRARLPGDAAVFRGRLLRGAKRIHYLRLFTPSLLKPVYVSAMSFVVLMLVRAGVYLARNESHGDKPGFYAKRS